VSQDTDNDIPVRGFGRCRWCGAEGSKLQYLMCPDCISIARMMPSKTHVVMNQPSLKDTFQKTGKTISAITPELVKFLLNPKNKFPSGLDAKKHWDKMVLEASEYVTSEEVSEVFASIKKTKQAQDLPSEDELQEILGMEGTIRYFLLYCVNQGLIKIEISEEDRIELEEIMEACLVNASVDPAAPESSSQTEQKQDVPTRAASSGMTVKKRV